MLGTVGRALPGPRRPPRRGAGGRRGQGPRRDGRGAGRRGPRPAAGAAPAGRAGRRAAAGAAGPATWPTPPAPGPGGPAPAQRGQADLPPGGGAAARRAGRRATWPARARAACWTRATCPTSATSWPRAGTLTRELDALWPTLSPEQLLTDLFADRRRLDSVAAGCPRADRERLARAAPPADAPADLAGPRPTSRCSTRPPSCSATTAPRQRAREAAALREEVDVRPGRAGRARPRGGPRPGAAARHGHRRRGPARRAPAGAPLRLHRGAGRGGPRVDLRPRDRRRGAGAVGDGLAADHAPVPDPVDDDRRRHRPDRRPGRRGVVAGRARAVRGEAVQARAAHRQLPDPRGDRRGGRRRPRRDRPDAGRAAVGPGDGRAAAGGAPADRDRLAGGWPTRSPPCSPTGGGPGRPGTRDGRGRRRRRAGSRCWPRPPGWPSCARGCSRSAGGDGSGEPDLDAPVVVLPVSAAKGLEFDAVVLVEPAESSRSRRAASTTSTSP